MDSPISTCGLSLSDTSVSDLGSYVTSLVIVDASPESKISVPSHPKGVPLFEPGDGDILVSVNGTRFEAHKYLIKRFLGLKPLLDKQPVEISILGNNVSAEDFSEMLEVLYALIITGPYLFPSYTLISALRVATAYEYHALRDYCVKCLEKFKLDEVRRIVIAHEFHLPSWEGPAYHELGMRDEPMTREEAGIIGLDAFVYIAEIREKEQRRRGREMDIGGERDTLPLATAPLAGEVSAHDSTREEGPHADAPCVVPSYNLPSPHGSKQGTNDSAALVDNNNNGPEIRPLFTGVELSGTYNWRSKYGYRVEFPGCGCRLIDQYGHEQSDWSCAMYPCTISALESIHVQQLRLADRISNLESSVKILNAPIKVKPGYGLSRTQPSTTSGLTRPFSTTHRLGLWEKSVSTI